MTGILSSLLVGAVLLTQQDLAQPVPATEQTKPAILELLERTWAANRNDVASAHLNYRFIRTGGASLKQLTYREVHQLVTSQKLTINRNALLKIVESVIRPDLVGKGRWSDREFWCDGAKTRDDRYRGGVFESAWFQDESHEVDVGLVHHNEVRLPNFQQEQKTVRSIKVYKAHTSGAVPQQLRDFRYIPDKTVAASLTEVVTVEGESVFRNASGTEELVVDESTAFVRRATFKIRGRVREETVQLGPITHAPGIVFPTAVVMMRFHPQRDAIYSISVLVIDQAAINAPIEPDTFVVSAPAGSGVFDYRGDLNSPKYRPIPEDTTDVLRLIDP